MGQCTGSNACYNSECDVRIDCYITLERHRLGCPDTGCPTDPSVGYPGEWGWDLGQSAGTLSYDRTAGMNTGHAYKRPAEVKFSFEYADGSAATLPNFFFSVSIAISIMSLAIRIMSSVISVISSVSSTIIIISIAISILSSAVSVIRSTISIMRSAAHSPTPSPPKPALCRATHPLSARVALRHALREAGLTTLMALLITPMTLPIMPMIMLITPRTLLITLMTMIVQVFGMNNGMFVAPYASDACNTEGMAGQCPVSVSCGGSRDAGTPCKLAESRVPSSLYNVIGPDTIHWTADSIKTPYTWGFPDRFTEAETSRGIKLW